MPTLRGIMLRAKTAWRAFVDNPLTVPGRYPVQVSASLFDLLSHLQIEIDAGPVDYPKMPKRHEQDAATRWSSEQDVSATMHMLARVLRPESVIEVGVFRGATAVAITAALSANQRGMHYGIDQNEGFLAETTGHIQDAGYADRFVPIQGLSTSDTVLAALPPQADLIFIDACHEYHAVADDFATYNQRLAPRGLLVFHDTIGIEGPRRVMLDVLSGGSWQTATVATTGGSGLSFLWRK